MTPYYQDNFTTLYQGDCRDVLKSLPDESVNCVVTSPPYWNLRDYKVDGQIGLEKSMFEHIEILVDVFREVKRVLRSDGTLWLNYGDAYAQGGKAATTEELEADATRAKEKNYSTQAYAGYEGWQRASGTAQKSGLKAKNLLGLPWRLAFALQDDGWILRSDIIWNKLNPLPESVVDRPTKTHEYLFLLAKSQRYYYNAEAILEDVSPNTHARISQNVAAQIGSARAHAGGKTNGNMKAVVRKPGVHPKAAMNAEGSRQNESFSSATVLKVEKRNKRTVWNVACKGYPDAHFATFPPDLIRPCILAGCPVGGVVLDPFAGSGTTLQVAMELQCKSVGIELSKDYCELIKKRFRQPSLLMAEAL